jgi:PleD family two-component response regulator
LFRSKISETASSLGIEAAFPRNPRRLLEAIHESPPDLLILDLNSARFEPLTLLKSVRSDEATRDVPTVDRVVARSAFTKDLQTGKWLEWLSPAPDRHRGP